MMYFIIDFWLALFQLKLLVSFVYFTTLIIWE